MSLRRPPTRIELKTEDIEEYTQMMKQRLASENAKAGNDNAGGQSGKAANSSSSKNDKIYSDSARKPSASERIGLNLQYG